MATDPICCTREGSPRARLWLWGHSREKVDERDKDKGTHHTLWTGNITAVKGRQGCSAEGEQDWRERSQRACRLSMDGGEHG